METLNILAEQAETLEEAVQVQTAIIAVKTYEQLARKYPTLADEYRGVIKQILFYFNK